jgi:hypothetical protein
MTARFSVDASALVKLCVREPERHVSASSGVVTQATPTEALFTIGHGTQPGERLLEALSMSEISVLVDVRRFPVSRRHPQFDREALEARLVAAGIAYRHDERLGGRRRLAPGDPRFTAWENASFRAYAAHMTTEEWRAAFTALREEASAGRVAVLCAETTPWRCHRRLIADAAVAGGWDAFDIMGPGVVRRHVLAPPADVTARGELRTATTSPPGSERRRRPRRQSSRSALRRATNSRSASSTPASRPGSW